MEQTKEIMIPQRIKTLRVEVRTWETLKSMKKENETFDDVLKTLLKERTVSVGDENMKIIRYGRKIAFLGSTETFLSHDRTMEHYEDIGYEFEYNDIKDNKLDFVLDLKIKKVFFRKRAINPSEFFGVDNVHKHYSSQFLKAYLKAVCMALRKELRIDTRFGNLENLTQWKKLYYDYNLSEESFIQDIEEPLRLSEEEKPSKEWSESIKDSVYQKSVDTFENDLGLT